MAAVAMLVAEDDAGFELATGVEAAEFVGVAVTGAGVWIATDVVGVGVDATGGVFVTGRADGREGDGVEAVVATGGGFFTETDADGVTGGATTGARVVPGNWRLGL